METAIRVQSEIGKLKKVLVHRPGRELERVTPELMNQLLFDDIMYLPAAQADHDKFVEILRGEGVEVLYVTGLIAQTLKVSDAVKVEFVEELVKQCGYTQTHNLALKKHLSDMTEEEIVKHAIEGITLEEFGKGDFGAGLSMLKSPDAKFVITPMPNLYFQRDPMMSIGDGTALSRMYYPARNRETIFAKFIFKYHPDFAGKIKYYYNEDIPHSIEGGDVLNLSEKVLAIGISERTSPSAIDALAKTIFSDDLASIDTIIAIEIPKQHNCMHLDTVFTQVDKDKFLCYGATMFNLQHVYVLKKTGKGIFNVEICKLPLDELLAKNLGFDKVTLIPLGGSDTITSAREQWGAAANTLALAPGKVISYDRNPKTQKLLEENGIHVLNIPSAELARGRGGPRCMSMPLYRDDV